MKDNKSCDRLTVRRIAPIRCRNAVEVAAASRQVTKQRGINKKLVPEQTPCDSFMTIVAGATISYITLIGTYDGRRAGGS